MSHAQAWIDRLDDVMPGGTDLPLAELERRIGPVDDLSEAVVEARAQKAVLGWLRARLEADPAYNRQFVDKTGLGWLDKLLTRARVAELAGTRIVKAGKSSGLRYDISGLGGTYYGRRILDGLGLPRRRTSATKEEYEQIRAACARIKLTLPETVQPTTTERFFDAG